MTNHAGGGERGRFQGDHLLYLTDEQLRQGAELMFFAYREFTAAPDRILARHGLGRAHHRALHFIARSSGLSVNDLLEVLGVTRQSLNRVLGELVHRGLVGKETGERDRRRRVLALTPAGQVLERSLSEVQRAHMRRAYREAGAEAVSGFRTVLEGLLDGRDREKTLGFVYRGGAG